MLAAHQARKRFGQHFLCDSAVVDAIVRAIAPKPGQAIVEIGPGLGALTLPLLARLAPRAQSVEASDDAAAPNAPCLTVVELDRDLAAAWQREARVHVVQADALTVDFTALAKPAAAVVSSAARWRVVGNLPYNVSTPILFHLLAHVRAVQDQHFMLQKEVVERMAAGPGSKAYGRLSVMLQWRYAIDALFDVPPTAFDPPPKVDSSIVRMVPKGEADVAGINERRLAEIVTLAFSQRRKLLRHTLGAWIKREGLDTAFDVQRRAEEVPVAEYVGLSRLAPKS